MAQNFEEIVDSVINLKLSEVASLVAALRERLNLPDIPMVGPMQGAVQAADADVAAAKEEKSAFSLVLKSFSDKKTQVIKAMKEVMKKLGKEMTLKELKDLVESAPVKVADDLSKDDVGEYLKILSDAGAECASE